MSRPKKVPELYLHNRPLGSQNKGQNGPKQVKPNVNIEGSKENSNLIPTLKSLKS